MKCQDPTQEIVTPLLHCGETLHASRLEVCISRLDWAMLVPSSNMLHLLIELLAVSLLDADFVKLLAEGKAKQSI